MNQAKNDLSHTSKIVHFGKFYAPESGGIEYVTTSLAEKMASCGHTVTVICFARDIPPKREIIRGVLIQRTKIIKQISSQPLGIKYFFQCIKYGMDADLVHLHAPNLLASLCALLLPAKTKLLVHWHSDIINKGFIGKLIRPLEWLLLKRANSIVTGSEAYASGSISLLPFLAKTNAVPFGVREPESRKEKQSRLPALIEEKIKDKKVILAVGRMVPYKGYDILIDSAQYLPSNVVIVVVGDGPLASELSEKIISCGFSDKVILTGGVDSEELDSLFRRAVIYCMSSTNRAEAFGVVLAEAMSYGLPIVATNIKGSGVPWVNKHGISGMNVPTRDPESLAKACVAILESEKLKTELARGSNQRYLQNFTETTFQKSIMDIYNQLLAS